MIPEENTGRPGMGHNQPPSGIETLVAEQREALTEFQPRVEEIIERMNARDVEDSIDAGKAGDLIRIGKQMADLIDKDRKERTNPYRKAADDAKAVADTLLNPLDEAMDALITRLNAWTEKENDAVNTQRAEQAAILGDAAAAPVDISDTPVPKREPKKVVAVGDLGAKVRSKENVEYEITDVRAIPDYIMQSPTVHGAIIQVVKSMAKHVPDVPGVKKTITTGNRIT